MNNSKMVEFPCPICHSNDYTTVHPDTLGNNITSFNYDYTKNYLRFDKILPSNYHLTFSRSETNEIKALELLNAGYNVAMVFDALPESYKGFKVVNGDLDDLRFKDEKNVIVGLKYKKMTDKGADNSLAFTSGFAIQTLPTKIAKVVKKRILEAA